MWVRRNRVYVVSLLLSSLLLSVCGAFGDETQDHDLLQAVDKGNQERVKSLLDQGANVNAKGINDTAIETAIFNQDVPMVGLLLGHGATLKPRDLAEAARGEQGDRTKAMAIVRLLLDKGGDQAASGGPALDAAATVGDFDVLKLLLAKGVPVDARDDRGDTSLMHAAQAGNLGTLRILLDAGARVDAKNKDGATALMKAASLRAGSDVKAGLATLQLLLDRGAAVNAPDRQRQTALFYAVHQHMSEAGGVLAHSEIVELLLAHGADPKATDQDGDTPLLRAAGEWRSSVAVVETLLDHGSQVNAANHDRATALMIACRQGRMDLAQLLLAHGAPVNARSRAGGTPLSEAVGAGYGDVVQLLLNHGADLARTPYRSRHALMAATINYALLRVADTADIAAVEAQLKQGADVNARDSKGQTPLLVSAMYGNDTAIATTLLQHGANVNAANKQGMTALMRAAAGNNSELTKLLLLHHADVNLVDRRGWSALHFAADGGHTQPTEMLVRAGANVNAADKAGHTPLMLACNEFAQDDLLQLLLEHGAQVDARDPSGMTALMMAARFGSLSGVPVLLAHGASVTARDKAGRTALDHILQTQEMWSRQEWAPRQREAVAQMLRQAAGQK